MKSTKIFFLYIVLLAIVLFSFDLIKDVLFFKEHYFLIVGIKVIFFVISAFVLMGYMLDGDSFKRFLFFYPLLIAGYCVLKYIEIKTVNCKAINLADYLYVIPLFTPLPLVFFWVLNNVFFIKRQPDQ